MNNLMNEFQQLIFRNCIQQIKDPKYLKLKNYYDDLGMAAIHYALQYDNIEAFKYILDNFKQLSFVTKKKIFMYKNQQCLTATINQSESKLYNSEPKEIVAVSTQTKTKVTHDISQCVFCQNMNCPQYRLPTHSSILIFACAANSQRIIRHLLHCFTQEGNTNYLSLLGLQNDLGINALQTCLLTNNFNPINIQQINQEEEQCDLNLVTNDLVLRNELCQVTNDNLTTLMIAGFCKRTAFIQFIQGLYQRLTNDQNGDLIYKSYITQMILRQDNGFTCITAAENMLDYASEGYYLQVDNYSQCGVEMRRLYDLLSK